jgi:uncharacterized membrane protein YqiK
MIEPALAFGPLGPWETLWLLIVLVVVTILVVLVILFVRLLLRNKNENIRLRLEVGKLADELEKARRQKGNEASDSKAQS